MTTIEGLRDHPMVDAFVRADALQCGFCTPGQIVSAVALVESTPHPTREEIRHRMAGNLCRCGTYPRIEEAISTGRMARLIRTEKEVEGRREEVWIVVEEDALEQWPAGPLDVVGRPAPRRRARARARRGDLHRRPQLPGMLHTAVLRSPHAHGVARSIDLAPALDAPGVRAARSGPTSTPSRRVRLRGRRGRGRLRRDARAGRARSS